MRILLVATDIQVPGSHGGSTHVAELFRGLSARADTMLLAREDSTGERVIALGKPLRHDKKLMRHTDPARLVAPALRALRQFAPDAIYERCSSYGLGAMLSVASGAPLLTMVLDERYSWLSLLRARKLVATRLELIPRAVRHKAEQVHWGANVDLFSPSNTGPEVRRQLGLAPDDFVIGYSGSFKRWHGLGALVEVSSRWRDPRVRFLLIGDGPCRAELEADAAQRGLSERFLFTGLCPYEEVPRLLEAVDVCVAPFAPKEHGPSREAKTFVLDPLKVFEYLALGKPTITIRAPNIERIFEHETHLMLYRADDVDDLLRTLRSVRAEPEAALAMARRGRERVLQRYTWQAHADHLYRLFEEMRRG